jgi:molybdenum cofactor cytidylyltransferase
LITAIILAAGMSSRLGTPKQLLNYQGRPLIRHVAETFIRSQVKRVIVVVGAHAETICEALDGLPVKIVFNQDFADGQSTSVNKGLGAINDKTLPQGVLFALGDQPLLKAETINLLITAFMKNGGIVVPFHHQKRGNPVIFHQKFLPEFKALSGDVGAREIIRRHNDEVHRVDVGDQGVLLDIDTWEDYEQLNENQSVNKEWEPDQ